MTAPTLEAERAAPELAPCPFCAGQARLVEWTASPAEIKCEACGIAMDGLRDEVIAAWNRRATPAAEGVALPKQSIDTPEFISLLDSYAKDGTRGYNYWYRAIISYIDGRTAGAAPSWQPIETAPKDGSAVLLSRPDSGGSWIGKYEPVYQSGYRPDNPWFSLMLNRDYLSKPLKSSAPTHWMPLPAAPQMDKGNKAQQS